MAASPVAAGVAPSVGADCAGVEAGAVVDAGFEDAAPNRLLVAPAAGAAEEGVAAPAPAAPLNSEEAGAGAVEVVVVAPLAGVELDGVLAAGLLKRLELPLAAGALGVDDPAAPNRPGEGAAAGAAALSLSPPPRLNPPREGVAAGVALGWALPPNKPPAAGLGVSCELGAAAGVPNRPAGVDGVALLFAVLEPAAFPNKVDAGLEAPAGLAPNKLDEVPDAGAAGLEAAFANKLDPDVFPPAWLFCPRENRPPEGGGPAGVVEGSAKVLVGAGVAVGVDEPVK